MHIVKFLLKLLYIPFKLLPHTEKVTMISRQSNEITLDFSLLKAELNEINPSLPVVVLTKKLEKNYITYAFHMLVQMYHIATSKVVVLDGYCIIASLLNHKKGVRFIQIWHALGCIKKFGYDAIDTEEGSNHKTAEIMRMHANYDIVSCASEATAKLYARAFNVSEDSVKIWGMPRVDYIKNLRSRKTEILKEYPHLRGKKIILYIPTFRKNQAVQITDLIKAVDLENYHLLVRLHPLDDTCVNEAFVLDHKYSTYELIEFADYIISDYSAVAIEACILNKPLYYYLYDFESYKVSRGLNMELYDGMESIICKDGIDLMYRIQSEEYDYSAMHRFRNKYIQTLEFSNTKKLAEEILARV